MRSRAACGCSVDVGHSWILLEEHKRHTGRIKNTICCMAGCVDSYGRPWCGCPPQPPAVSGVERYLEGKKFPPGGGAGINPRQLGGGATHGRGSA